MAYEQQAPDPCSSNMHLHINDQRSCKTAAMHGFLFITLNPFDVLG